MGSVTTKYLNRATASFLSSFKNWKRTVLTASFSLIFYFLFVFNTNIPWHLEIARTGNILQIFEYGTASLITSSLVGFSLTLIYSVVAAITLTVTITSLRANGIEFSGLGGALPGFVAAGCSCGIGMAGLIGLAGVTSALPFQGNLIKVAGIILMFYALVELGKPEKCDIHVSYE